MPEPEGCVKEGRDDGPDGAEDDPDEHVVPSCPEVEDCANRHPRFFRHQQDASQG
ncbi:hypothetical protein LCGC14_2202760, partial [marine sediment metagenome]